MKDYLMIPKTNLVQLQKVCDVYDIFDPAIDYIIRDIMKVEPILNRRTWEQAMIFLAIHQAGKLNKDSAGLGMGVGVEKSIFAFAELTESVVATDLYHSDSGWSNVRTKVNPTDHILKVAPKNSTTENIVGKHMDMRNITFENDTFDYAWSTGSFEHIGTDNDFSQHLSEVHRVLKPGGVYAFTTAINYNGRSQKNIGNYFFHPEHMIDLVHQSPLLPKSEFDCSINNHFYNRPLTNRSQDYGFLVGKTEIHPFVAFTRGLITAANSMVLVKDDERKSKAKRPQIVGFEKTRSRLRFRANHFTKKLWSNRQVLNAEKAIKDNATVTQPQFFGDNECEFEIGFVGKGPEKVVISIRERTIFAPVKSKVVLKEVFKNQHKIKIPFKASKNNIYRIKIEGDIETEDVVIHAYSKTNQ